VEITTPYAPWLTNMQMSITDLGDVANTVSLFFARHIQYMAGSEFGYELQLQMLAGWNAEWLINDLDGSIRANDLR
jgi:hypothetical protein